jgi:glyoxylase-like metal-dependent hydrolase (beta-lactamase superfamily II)
VTSFLTQGPTLTNDVFALKRSSLTCDVPPGTESLQWVANTAMLIAGTQDAVLVDTFATIDQNRQLVDWLKQSGKNLTTIYLTHAHGDHAFGIKIVQDHFPKARAVAMPAVAQTLHAQMNHPGVKAFWESRFPGQIPEPLVVPEPLDSDAFELEGQRLVVLDRPKTPRSTSFCWRQEGQTTSKRFISPSHGSNCSRPPTTGLMRRNQNPR